MISKKLSELHQRTIVVRTAPFAVFVGFLILGSIGSAWLEGDAAGILRDWLGIARGGLVAIVLILFWPAYSELHTPSSVSNVHWGMGIVAGLAVFLIWIALGQTAATATHEGRFVPLLADGSFDWLKALLRLAGLALVVPVMEELFWRSLVLRWIDQHEFLALDPRRVGFGAFVITTILFAVEHDMWLAGAIAGITYNALYMYSRNLWVPIAAHVATNGALGVWILWTRNWSLW